MITMNPYRMRVSAVLAPLTVMATLVTVACKPFSEGDFKPHVYLTWRSEDTARTMQVHYHTSGPYEASVVHWDTEPRGGNPALYRRKSAGFAVRWAGTERAVHHIELTGLEPGTVYYFITGDSKSGFGTEKKFKTLPGTSNRLRVVNGGDMSVGKDFEALARLAGQTNPDLALIGGDIAYANGDPANTTLWDRWLEIWGKTMVTSEGLLIPMVLAIGNHETNSWPARERKKRAPFYFSLFHQDPDQRTFFVRRIADDLSLFVLDSAHIESPFGKQREWLKQKLEVNRHVRTTMALYHAGLFPSMRSEWNPHHLLLRMSWLKLFDHFQLSLALEHHDHTLKRTRYLRHGSEVAPHEGTLYLGDGAWGKGGRTADTTRWYLAHAASEIHFWLLDIRADRIEASAIGPERRLLDHHILERRPKGWTPRSGPLKDDPQLLIQEIRAQPEFAPYLNMH